MTRRKNRFAPRLDKLYFAVAVPTAVLLLCAVIIPAIPAPTTLFITLPIALFTAYFLVASLFGYAELREDALFIRFGAFLTRTIPYPKIRAITLEKSFISESMLSLKNAIEHIKISYNRFDVVCISVRDEARFVSLLEEKTGVIAKPRA